jgi:hypothetical protein
MDADAPLEQAMESGVAICLNAQLPQTRYPMGIPHRELLGFVHVACLQMLLTIYETASKAYAEIRRA